MNLVTRAQLGLRAAKSRQTMPLPAPYLFVHHTVTRPGSSDAAEAQQVQSIAFARGFSDISYSFLVSSRATPLEGRGRGIRGAHTVTKAGASQLKRYGKANWNGTSHAVSLVGNSDDALSDAQVNTFRWFREWLIETGAQRPPDGPWKPWKLGVSPQHGYYTPHQEVNATGCPGGLLIARLADINTPLVSGELPFTEPELDLSDLSDVDIEGLPDGLVAPGAYSQVVVWLQRFLTWRAAQYGRPEFHPGPVDGDYGPGTVAAMKAWREALGLDPHVGEWDSLVRSQSLAARAGVPLVGSVIVTPPQPPQPPAPVAGTPILAATGATDAQAKAWAKGKLAHPVFDDIIDALYAAPNEHGVDLAGAVAQAAIETGFGHFGGVLTAEWKNPAGLKVTGRTGDAPDDHHRFVSWDAGADAEIVHLALYAGKESTDGLARDPRYGLWVFGIAPTWEQLSMRWAMLETYGTKIVALRVEIVATPPPVTPPGPPPPDPVETFVARFDEADLRFSAFAAEWERARQAARAVRDM